MQSADARSRALEKVLASNCFAGSARLRELLARLSGAALDGSPEPKEYEIGLEVFERPPSFDPRIDSIVRVQINRLRHKLREYYETEGAADPIRVELPKGGYRPVFREVSAAHATAPVATPANRNRLRRAIPLLAASALIVIAAAWSLTPRQVYQPARRIAVMPLQFTGSPDEEYLSDGLTDELTNQLARVPALRVSARRSAFAFKDTPWDVKTAAEKLGVDLLVDGSMTTDGSSLRLSVELVDAATAAVLWSDTLVRTRDDLPEIGSRITASVLSTLRLTAPAPRANSTNVEARNLYLKGMFFWNKRTHEALLKGIDYFHQSIAKDPTYALPYAGLAATYGVMSANVLIDTREGGAKGKAAAEQALRLDPGLADAHAALGLIRSVCDWDWHGADAEFRKAIELNPSHASAHQWRAHNLLWLGRFQEATTEIRRALELDPLSLVIQSNQAEFAYFSRDYNRALRLYRETLESDPQFISAHIETGMTYLAKNAPQQAIDWFNKALALTHEEASPVVGLAIAYAGRGETQRARQLLSDLESAGRPFYLSHIQLAYVLGAIGEKDRAFDELEQAYRLHEAGMMQLRVAPLVDCLRSDARFQALLKKMNL
jgi:serine/threonine-protein kinase